MTGKEGGFEHPVPRSRNRRSTGKAHHTHQGRTRVIVHTRNTGKIALILTITLVLGTAAPAFAEPSIKVSSSSISFVEDVTDDMIAEASKQFGEKKGDITKATLNLGNVTDDMVAKACAAYPGVRDAPGSLGPQAPHRPEVPRRLGRARLQPGCPVVPRRPDEPGHPEDQGHFRPAPACRPDESQGGHRLGQCLLRGGHEDPDREGHQDSGTIGNRHPEENSPPDTDHLEL